MLLSTIFAILFIHTTDPRYKQPLDKSLEATYVSMPEKRMIDNKVEEIKNQNKFLTTTGALVYSGIYRKQYMLRTSKLPLVNQTSLYYDSNNHSGSVNFTFNF